MSARPTLLFVSPRFLLPVDSGGKIRTTQMLRGMLGKQFKIVLACPLPDNWQDYQAELNQLCDELVGWSAPVRGPGYALTRMRHLWSSLPIPVLADASERGRAAVAEQLPRADVVVFDFPHSVVLAPERIDCPSVMFTHNVEAEIFARHVEVASDFLRRAIWRNQHRKMCAFEREALSRFDVVIAVSKRDGRMLESDYGLDSVVTIDTGVDLDFFAYGDPQSEPKVVFMGSMDWLANIDGMEFFLAEVWPRVLEAVPGAAMHVVGRSPPERLVKMAQGLNWTFSGFVDDVREHVRGAACFVIPLRVGGGTRLKAYEAMAMGCPVVSTTIGVEGLPVVPNEHYLRADTSEELARGVIELLKQPARGIELARAAREFVAARFSYQAIAADFARRCEQAMEVSMDKRSEAGAV